MPQDVSMFTRSVRSVGRTLLHTITINIRVHRGIPEMDVLVIPLQNLEAAPEDPAAGLSTEESPHVVRILTRRW